VLLRRNSGVARRELTRAVESIEKHTRAAAMLSEPRYGWIVSPASSIATNLARRRARVSGFLASWSR
jgi:hypothetical protein